MKKTLLLATILALTVFSCTTARAVTTANLLRNGDAETGDLIGWDVNFSTPRVDDGTFNDGLLPHAGKFSFLGYAGEFASLSQRIDLSDAGLTAEQLDSGALFAQISFWSLGLDQGTPSDSARVALIFRDDSGNSISTTESPEIDSHLQWSNYRGAVKIPARTRSIEYVMEFIRRAGTDLDAYFDDNSLIITDSPSAPTAMIPATSISATIRDFRAGGDFEGDVQSAAGLVSAELGADGKPHFVGEPGAGGIGDSNSFDMWFNDILEVTRAEDTTLVLEQSADQPGVYVYERNEFFPIDNRLWGNTPGEEHNYHFTLEAHSTFTFHGDEFVELTTDDDGWLYINGKLAIDLGGTHDPQTGRVELNTLGLALGQTYQFDLFYAERHASGATLILKTNVRLGGPSQGQFADGNWSAKYVQLNDSVEAECLVRVGDIDNLGFGWPADFNVFAGGFTPVHDFPWEPDPADPAGTDRIEVVSSYNGNAPNGIDGYTDLTKRPGNSPQAITMDFDFAGEIKAAVLQMFLDDFQATVFGANYQVKLNGIRAPFLETIINSLDGSGPIGRLVSVAIPTEYLSLLSKGRLVISIDDPTTGAGDGFAIDFARLLINPKSFTRLGGIEGVVADDSLSGLGGALVIASDQQTYTDDDGHFSFTNIVAGSQHLSVSKDGFVSREVNVEVAAGQTADPTINLVQFIDSDGDGLSDQDELNIYHTDPNKADTDGDGMSDAAEIKAGSDPNSAATALRISSLAAAVMDEGFALGVQATVGRTYQLQRWNSDNFSQPGDPVWIEVQTVIATGEQVAFNAPTLGRQQGYFRIIEAENGSADPTPPTLEPPTAWPATATDAGTVTLRVVAADNVGVTSVRFVEGSTVLGSATRLSANVWQYAWPVTAALNGSHTIIARASDAAGNIGVSGPLAFNANIQSTRKSITVDGITISADSIVTNGLNIQVSGNIQVAGFVFTADTQVTISSETHSISVHGQVDLAGVDLPGPIDFVIEPVKETGAIQLKYSALNWLEFQLHDALLKLGHDSKGAATAEMKAMLSLAGLPDFNFSARLDASGAPALIAALDNDLLIAGQAISGIRKGAVATLSLGKVSVAGAFFGGVIDTLGLVNVSGVATITPAGQISLSGTVSVPAIQSGAFKLRPSAGNAFSATLSSTGLTLAAGGQIDYAGVSLGSFKLPSISIAANGDFSVHLSSRPASPLSVSLLGYLLENSSFTFARSGGEMGISGFSAKLRLPTRLGSQRISVTGNIAATGKFSLTGTTASDVNFNGFTADMIAAGATATLSETGLQLHGVLNGALFSDLKIPGLSLDVAVSPAGILAYSSDINVPGLDFGQIDLRAAAGGETGLLLKVQADKIILADQSKLLYGKAALGNFSIPPITISANGDFTVEVGTTGNALAGMLGGFALQEVQFVLQRSGGVVSLDDFRATIALGGLATPVAVRLTGSLGSDGHYDLEANTTVALGFNNLPVSTMDSGAAILLKDGALTATGPLLGGVISALNLPAIIGTANFTASGTVSLGGTVTVPPLDFDSFKIQPPTDATDFLATLSSTGLLIPAGAELWYRAQKLGDFGLPAISIANNGDFSVSASASNASLRGFNVANVAFTLVRSSGNVSVPNFQADLNNPLLKQHVSGALHSDGTFALVYNGSVNVGPFTLVNATVTLFPGGLDLAGSPTIPGMPFTLNLDGNVLTDGSFALTESFATQTFYGFPVKNASYTLAGDTTGASLSANVNLNFPGGAASAFNTLIRGPIQTDGSFNLHLSAPIPLNVLGYQLSNVALELKRAAGAGAITSLSSAGDIAVVGLLPHIVGQISTTGLFDLVYNGDFNLAGFSTLPDVANAIHLTENGVTAAGKFALSSSVAGALVNFGTINFGGALKSDSTFDLRGSGSLNFGPFTTDTFEMALTQAGVFLGSGGSPNVNFGNLKIPFNVFQLTKDGLAQFSGSTSGDSGWLRFPSGTPFNGTFASGDLFGRLIWNLGASASVDGNISANLTGTFGAWDAIANPPPNDINNSDVHFTVGPTGISSNGAFTVIETFHDLTSFGFTLW